MQAVAIVVAAGRGERMGRSARRPSSSSGRAAARARRPRLRGGPLGGEDRGGGAGAGARRRARALAALPKLLAVVAGGERRQDSVLAGLQPGARDFEGIVLVHDAARPLVDVELIEAVAQQAAADGRGAAGAAARGHRQARARGARRGDARPRRAGGAQTPQGFRCALLREACASALAAGIALTDEAMAVERLGHAVYAVPARSGTARSRRPTTSRGPRAWLRVSCTHEGWSDPEDRAGLRRPPPGGGPSPAPGRPGARAHARPRGPLGRRLRAPRRLRRAARGDRRGRHGQPLPEPRRALARGARAACSSRRCRGS